MKVLSRLYYSYPNEKNLKLAWESFLNHNFGLPNYYYIVNCVFILVPLVEINYWLVIKKYSFLKSLLITTGMITLYAIVTAFPFKITEVWYRFGATIFLLTFYAIAYGFIRKIICQYLKNKKDTIERYDHELQTLRAQWNPHFFSIVLIIFTGQP